MFKTVLFDLDGTIANSFPGIANGILYALDKLSIPAPEREELKCFVGPPLFDQFKAFFKMNDKTANEAVKLYREYYSKTGIYEQTPIDGAEELFKSLREMNITVCLATCKPLPFAERIIEYFGFESYFKALFGASFDGSVNTKRQVITLALNGTGTAPEDCLMVGDRKYDVEGAHECGVKCAGVLCGFGTNSELRDAGADFIVPVLGDIIQIVS